MEIKFVVSQANKDSFPTVHVNGSSARILLSKNDYKHLEKNLREFIDWGFGALEEEDSTDDPKDYAAPPEQEEGVEQEPFWSGE